MKKALSILLLLVSFNSFSQVVDTYLQELDSMDEFYRESDWKFYPDSVIKLSDSTYLMLAIPYDYNDPGAIERIVGNYVIDYVGHTFEVIDSLTTDRTITVYDKWKTGQAPQSSQIAKCYLSVMSGRGKEVGSSDYTPLEMSARWRKNGMDNERLYRHGMVYDDPFMRNVMDTTYIPDSSEVKGTTYFDSIRNNMVTKLAHIDYPWSEKLTFRAFNGTGATITKGSIVTPDTVTVIALADNRSEYKSRIIAFAAHDIPPSTEGTLIKAGQIENFNTSSYTLGAELYLGENGQMTEVEPTGGAFNNIVAVVDSVGVNGSITVDISISLRTAEQNKYTGWPDADGNSFPDNVGISIDTVNRKFILYATPGSEYYYYHRGQKYIHTTDTFQWSNVEGIHLMYFDGDTIAEIVNPTDAQSSETLRNNTGIVNLYWSIPQNDYIYVNNEFHTFDMNGQTKAAFYDIHGCTVIDPITLTDFDVDGTGNLNSNAQFGNAAGSIRNQDLKTYTPSTLSTTGYTIFYREGTAAWRSASNPGYGVVNVGTGRIAYNQNVGGVHSLAEATNGSYVPYYLLVSNTLGLKYGMVPGDNQYANSDDAVAGALQKIPGFLQNLPIKAIASLAIVVYQTRDNYTNAVKGRIVSVTNPLTDETVEYIDLTEPGIIGGGVGGTGMQTLTDDPNGQPSYAGYGGSFVTVNDAETGWEFTPDTKQENITLTTNFNSGPSTFVGDVLNVPNYVDGLGDGRLPYFNSGLINSPIYTDGSRIRIGASVNPFAYNFQIHQNNGSGVRIWLTNNDAGSTIENGFLIQMDDLEAASLVNYEQTDFKFYTYGSLRQTIKSNGNILVNTTADNGDKFQVNGNASFSRSTLGRHGVIKDELTDGTFPLNVQSLSIGGVPFVDSYISAISSPANNTIGFTGQGSATTVTLTNIAKTNAVQTFQVTNHTGAVLSILNTANAIYGDADGLIVRTYGQTGSNVIGRFQAGVRAQNILSIYGNGNVQMPYLPTGTQADIAYLDANGYLYRGAASGGMSDPMTTVGDMIYRNGSNITSRLPIGTTFDLLYVVGGVPTWTSIQTVLDNLGLYGGVLDPTNTGIDMAIKNPINGLWARTDVGNLSYSNNPKNSVTGANISATTETVIILTAGGLTVTLPSSGLYDGRTITVANRSTAGTIGTYSTLSGGTSTTIPANSSITIMYDLGTTTWYQIK